MTLKYESEILFDLMKRDGDDTPSDVLPYESELKEKYLNQVVGAYPKLQDYRPEWLNYNLYHHLPSDFPVESVTNVTNATFENVVPYAYKSAILMGNTLVNLIGEKREYTNLNGNKLHGWEFMLPYNLTSGKTYLAIFDVSGTIDESNSKVYLMDNGFISTSGNTSSTIPTFSLGHNVVKCIATNDKHKVLRIRTTYNENEKFTVSNVMLIEYQEGMENWDIPYFTGMQSVKMPVLTTTGKNLLDSNNFVGNEFITLNQDQSFTVNSNKITQWSVLYKNLPDFNNVYIYIDIDGATNFGGSIGLFYKGNKTAEFSSNKRNGLLIEKLFDEIRVFNAQGIDIKVRLMLSYNAETSYEPYKSNILSTPEDVELRGVGEVQDTLDCLTGEMTQRVKERVLNGDESWDIANNNSVHVDVSRFKLRLTDAKESNTKLISDKFKYSNTSLINDEVCYFGGDYNLYVNIHKNKLSENSITGFKTWLSNNPLTIQYELGNPHVKTVDLSCINEQGESETFRPIEGTMHVNTSSQTLPALLDMSVPVEATSQNLMSFANIVEEE